MHKTIREEPVGKLIMRLLKTDDGYIGGIIGGGNVPHIHGDNAEEVWARLRLEIGRASPFYFGYDGARNRFLKLFPEAFVGEPFIRHERAYKVAASEFLRRELPLESALSAGSAAGEIAARAYSKTNMLSTFEQARTREVLKGKDGAAFIRAAAALASGDHAQLPEIERIFRPYGPASWPAATYLPFLWLPEAHMFLKPEVTRDYSERVGHPFARTYEARLSPEVYRQLLALVAETKTELSDLNPKDNIDIQSFLWIVGAYDDDEAAVV